MSIAQLSVTLKLDLAYSAGAVVFVTDDNILVPLRNRRDICETESGEIQIHIRNRWVSVTPEMIKFCRRH
jgi:hypothetical protein